MTINDPLWNDFRSLWSDLPLADDKILVAGGYGLLLKQRWILDTRNQPIVTPIENWRDGSPRVTKDIDIVVGLELLASIKVQEKMVAALGKNQFKVVEDNPRWQFQKELETGGKIMVDLHAELPEAENRNLASDKMRVKHKPSLGESGVHGRQNPEAAGSHLYPFKFPIEGVTICVPNPVTWSVMKLVATKERLTKTEEINRDERSREFHRNQAVKHARDVTRIIAMTTRDERDCATEIIGAIRETAGYVEAVSACDKYFGRNDRWGSQVNAGLWQDEDLIIIQETLKSWFR